MAEVIFLMLRTVFMRDLTICCEPPKRAPKGATVLGRKVRGQGLDQPLFRGRMDTSEKSSQATGTHDGN